MKLEFLSVREELDLLLDKAKREKRTVKKIVLTKSEADSLREEFNLYFGTGWVKDVSYKGVPVEVKND